MSTARKFLPSFLAFAALAGALRAADPLAARIILLVNRDDPDSLRIARHYAEVRQVPLENIVVQGMPLQETITWSEFVTTVWQPLQDELIRKKWIGAIPMALVDDVGRTKNAMGGHRISYLVLCRGVPLRIAHDPARYHPHPPLTDNPFFQTNAAAVDSELSLLAVTDSPINAFLVNPLFGNDRPSPAVLNGIVKVSRLDGPTPDDALLLVDRAVAAERTGLIGRAYVDLGGIHPDGDTWLKVVAAQIRALGFDLDVDEHPSTIPATARCDSPALYFGWYAPKLNGPFALPGFRFPPGAIAVHIHSASAETLRSTSEEWTGPLVARGVTATVGNVYEPYLQLLHRPDLLLRALARGDRFGDAACYAEPALSWQAIAIGDPLYRPFAEPFKNLSAVRSDISAAQKGYLALRALHLAEATGHPADALREARSIQQKNPSLALGLALALRDEKAGNTKEEARELEFAATFEIFPPDEWALAHDVAETLVRVGKPARAVQLYRHLLRDPALPAELRGPWLHDARLAANAAGEIDQDAEWAAEMERRTEPSKK